VYRDQGKYIEAEGLLRQRPTLDEGHLSRPTRKRRKKN
jgi:hypothetical protein